MIINIGVYIAKNLHYCVEIKLGLYEAESKTNGTVKVTDKTIFRNNEFFRGTIFYFKSVYIASSNSSIFYLSHARVIGKKAVSYFDYYLNDPKKFKQTRFTQICRINAHILEIFFVIYKLDSITSKNLFKS